MLSIALQILYFVAIPLVAIELAKRYRLFEVLNPVVFCYLAGIALVNSPVFEVHAETAKIATEASIPLAIPLVLFSSDFRAWLSQSRPAVISFVCTVVAVLASSFLTAQFFSDLVAESWKVSGMLMGVYSGGTPNLMSIGMALDAKPETFALLNAADLVVGGVYLLFLLTVAKPILKHVFPAYKPTDEQQQAEPIAPEDDAPLDLKAAWPQMLAGLGLSVLALAISAGATLLVAGELAVAGIFLGITTAGILGSMWPKVRNLEGSYELGNYLILVFCVAMGARTDIGALMSSGSSMLVYTVVVISGAIALHFVLARLFRVDVDTLLITSTAAVYGPAFVGPIAEAIDNRQVILSGLTAGIVGYAVGNYLGLALAYMLAP
ncbi:DUF819 family protein [Persicimonas caeni]|uniref:DUF819 family protein n=1 Tax=Persicimonas caeni TaxID=2292766 RepID=A0A4Y6PQL8_PERCE|nr:DUF819 family protein [Persicimonas caeni]QDG50606.1 DUF819 family protein [Persicimonas caeni]QED31827.1 DUF819 family protein [Persicimonas caeni]